MSSRDLIMSGNESAVVVFTDGALKSAGIYLYRDGYRVKALLEDARVIKDMGQLGYIGEETNKKLGYLVAISRKLDSPLSSAILSRAGAGKSTLMDVLADITPPDDLVRFTRITPQALYYAGRQGLRHKVLMCAEDEGLAGSDYAIRELISAKKIRLATPINDAQAGQFRTIEYEVEGPIALLFSTTRPAIHFENATRCFTISLDESFQQTKDILKEQRRKHTLARIEERPILEDLKRLHRNIQRLLRPLVVINPFAPYLEFPTNRLEMRREHEKYLSLIDAIALLHQHQREIWATEINGRKVEYIEVTVEDVEEANKLMTELLGASREELSRPSRELLDHIKAMVEERAKATGGDPSAVRFNRRDIREHAGWSDSQIKAHIRQLEDLEYLLISKGERGRLYRYELAPEAERKRLPGLTDIEVLRSMVRKSGMGRRGLAMGASAKSSEIPNENQSESLKVGRNEEGERGVATQGVAAHA